MKKINYDSKPSAIEAVGNGSYLYRWDIEEQTTEATEEVDAHTYWVCYEVVVWNTPTSESITETVIAALWSPSEESKLINDYNAALKDILDQSYVDSYVEFLTQRKALKEQIAVDFALWQNGDSC